MKCFLFKIYISENKIKIKILASLKEYFETNMDILSFCMLLPDGEYLKHYATICIPNDRILHACDFMSMLQDTYNECGKLELNFK